MPRRKRCKKSAVKKNKLFESLLTDSSTEKSPAVHEKCQLNLVHVRQRPFKDKKVPQDNVLNSQEASQVADISKERNQDIQTSDDDYQLHVSIVKNTPFLRSKKVLNNGCQELKAGSVHPSTLVLSSTPNMRSLVSAPCADDAEDLSIIKAIPEVVDAVALSVAEENIRRLKREAGCNDDSVLGGSPTLPRGYGVPVDEIDNRLLNIHLDNSDSTKRQ